jgi:CBS domain-containing protein
MKRWVYAYTIVEGQPGELDHLLRTRLPDLLHRATDSDPEAPAVDGTRTLRLESEVAGLHPSKNIQLRTGVAQEIDRLTRIPVSWQATPGRHAFPLFDGAIEFEPMSERNGQLTVVGSYRIPLGMLGAAVDGVALSTVAQRTITALAERLGEELEAMTAEGPAPVPEDIPSGSVLRVADVMTSDPMTFDETLTVRSAALLLVYRGVQGAPVVNETGALVGVLSEQDLLEKEAAFRPPLGRGARERERRRAAVTVGGACSRPARVTVPEATLRDAAREMIDQGVARLVVVDASAIVGIITRHDILKALLRSDAELQSAVDAILASLSEPDVRAEVTWGEVTLSGIASVHSKVPHIVRMISDIDGIIAVHGEPRWREDDVVQSVYGPRGR